MTLAALRARLAAAPRPGDLSRLAELVGGVAALVDVGWAQSDEARPYGRNVLWSEAGLEVMVARWTPGLWCAPHDHGGAMGVVLVLQGAAMHRVWSLQGPALVVANEHRIQVGDVLRCPPSAIHSMRADAGELVTLHAYAPGIASMMVYDVGGRESLEVDGGCGAWVPMEDAVVRRWPGFVGLAATRP
jgi:predicted metal-dependent enzyme (double-stranded beta helix superfamily)